MIDSRGLGGPPGVLSLPLCISSYLDESGVIETHPDQTTHFVVLGVAVHETIWYELEKQIAKVREQLHLPPRTELHARWILRQYREQGLVQGFGDLQVSARRRVMAAERSKKLESYTSEPKRRRRAREFHHTEPFVHLTRSERNDLVDATLNVIGGHKGRKIHLFGEAINKETLNSSIDPLEECYDQIVTRF